MRTHLTIGRKLSLAAVSVLVAGSVVACGGDSTVDNGDTEVPSVAEEPESSEDSEASSTDTPSESEDAEDTEDADSDSGAAPGGENAPQDGEVEEVEEPGGEPTPRTEEDDAFLAQLKDNGIEVEDSDIEDQVIASGREQCLANDEGRDSFAVPMVAGQLQALEMTDKDPEEAGQLIREAAEAHYCG
ncbi:MAG TPA: DUF732 domain-containing protein [Candidatus Corynebacterium avicola]|uniref:DUF732 domain-containing protein n=1 Tax=Candidatus Corynebacterium avicola TaxID=2838527 RepID=A0A9D1UMQ9_9CORY|nr:DUF732 domain-containing protein [Candidatus Corynebacterium avicola]